MSKIPGLNLDSEDDTEETDEGLETFNPGFGVVVKKNASLLSSEISLLSISASKSGGLGFLGNLGATN